MTDDKTSAITRLTKITQAISSHHPEGTRLLPASRGNAGAVPLKVTATYHGTESLGYVPEQTYEGLIIGNTFYPNDPEALPCPYTVGGFLKLWSDISISPASDHHH